MTTNPSPCQQSAYSVPTAHSAPAPAARTTDATSRPAADDPPRRLVLDTNIVIDLLHFANPATDWLRAGMAAGRLRCFTSPECLSELASVLPRPQFRLDAAGVARVLAAYEAWVISLPEENPAGSINPAAPASTVDAPRREESAHRDAVGEATGEDIANLPRCRDRDDQKFLVLAARCGADALITRDRELLRLAHPGRRCPAPFAILTAEAAAPLFGDSGATGDSGDSGGYGAESD
ncbi:PIN domain-containing protein [Rhodocyclus tenuis]|uniref:PIN domain-containing protein n=1 Tax=Rhodocyclus gracilis TaxID=2929842 RepID=UPI001298CBD4|nr:PIN domain-containing protein [Rhodocyclus gracilis]MRD73602.1 PIN domain-containing protein [Rhodocyclus gracilis]